MSEYLAGFVVVTAMLAPFALVAALTRAFPSLQRGIADYPRMDAVVARFFDGSRRGDDGDPARDRLHETHVPVEDRPSWAVAQNSSRSGNH